MNVPFFADTTELELEGINSLEEVLVRDWSVTGGSHTCRDVLTLVFRQTQDPELTFLPVAGHIEVTSLAKGESEDALESRVYDVTDLLIDDGNQKKKHGKATPASSGGKTDESKPKRARNGGTKKRKAGGKSRDDGDPTSKNPAAKVLKQFGAGGGGFGGGGFSGMGGGGGFGGGGSGGQPDTSSDSDTALFDMAAIVQLIQEQTSPPAKWFNTDGEGGHLSIYGQYLVIPSDLSDTSRYRKHSESVASGRGRQWPTTFGNVCRVRRRLWRRARWRSAGWWWIRWWRSAGRWWRWRWLFSASASARAMNDLRPAGLLIYSQRSLGERQTRISQHSRLGPLS